MFQCLNAHQQRRWLNRLLVSLMLVSSSASYAVDGNMPAVTTVIRSLFAAPEAERAPIKQTFTMLVRGLGSGRVKSKPAGINCTADCSASFNQGQIVTLQATPAAGSFLKKWGGACLGVSTNTCQVTLSAAKTARAVFALSIPSAPANLQAAAGDKEVTLTWTPSTSATTYAICKSTEAISDFNSCNSLADGELLIDQVSPAVISALDNGVEYHFKVVAKNKDASRPSSAEVTATPQVTITLAAGGSHTCAIVAGKSYCWGFKQFGLGDGSTVQSTTPKPVAIASQTLQIEGGQNHTCAVVAGGVKCWGSNDGGQLGDGTTTPSATPVTAINANSGVTQVSAGYLHSCAIVQGGVKCWGNNAGGQTGKALPKQGVTSIAAGGYHSCAVINGGVKCWGYNGDGQLGNGTKTDSATPVVTIPANSGVVSVNAGPFHNCAVLDGGVKCWGDNTYGQLGNGTKTQSLSPVSIISANRGATAVAAGTNHTCAVVSGGVQCWGYNTSGQLGDRSNVSKDRPVNAIMAKSGATNIVTGGGYTCALVRNSIKCWGDNSNGQFGNGTKTNSNQPVDGAKF